MVWEKLFPGQDVLWNEPVLNESTISSSKAQVSLSWDAGRDPADVQVQQITF